MQLDLLEPVERAHRRDGVGNKGGMKESRYTIFRKRFNLQLDLLQDSDGFHENHTDKAYRHVHRAKKEMDQEGGCETSPAHGQPALGYDNRALKRR